MAGTIATGGALAGVVTAATAATASTVATIAGLVAAGASLGAQVLYKPPPARGSLTQMIVQTDGPQPYVMGRTFFGGVLRHTAAYGATLKKVPNPYLGRVVVYSGSGPIDAIEELQFDFEPIGSYYSGFFASATQLGATPSPAALVAPFAGFTGWTSAHKLSGQAAALWNFKFDKDGKRFAGGVPAAAGAVLRGVRVYDPREDSTYLGGSGPQRIDNEATWAYSDNPALHALVYAYGRYQNGHKVFGIGLPVEAIDRSTFAAWANVCEANGWTISGIVFEPDDRWKNLKDIMAAGGGEPVFSGAVLSAKFYAPRVAIDTITIDDLTEQGGSVVAMRSYRDRLNTIVPKYRSEDHHWEYVADKAVQVASFLAEDGEEKREERQFNLVCNANQAAQLAAYELWERREIGLIELSCGPRLRHYRPGDCLTINLPDEGLVDLPATLLKRTIEPSTMSTTLTLIGETFAKHAYALGRTATPPPTPALGQTAEQRDQLLAASQAPTSIDALLIASSYVTDTDPLDGLIQATDAAITVEGHTRTYSDRTVNVIGGVLTHEDDGTTPLVAATLYHVYYDDPLREGGAVILLATRDSQVAANGSTNPARHYVGSLATDVAGGTGTNGGGASPPGWDPIIYCVSDDTPILLATGRELPACDLVAGTLLRTRHEDTLEWGNHRITAIRFVEADVFACRLEGRDGPVTIRATGDHRFWLGGEWVRARTIGIPDGRARVARITVADAHTYVSAGVLSHNIKDGYY